MKAKTLIPFLLLLVGIMLTSCEKENSLEAPSIEAADELQSRKGNEIGTPCFDDGIPETDCNCIYKIDYIQDQYQEWTLENYGNNSRCCRGGVYYDAVDVTDGHHCNGNSLVQIGEWRTMQCGLKAGLINFRFTSQNCDDECPYDYNRMKVTVRCTAEDDNPSGPNQSEVSFWLYANQNGPCTQGIGVNSILLGSDCDLQP